MQLAMDSKKITNVSYHTKSTHLVHFMD